MKSPDSYMSTVSLRRSPSPIRALGPLMLIPNMISLGPGRPNPTTFPVTKIQFTLQDGTVVSPDDNETKKAMQYSAATGTSEFSEIIMEYQKLLHAPRTLRNDWGIAITNGSQDALYKTLSMLMNSGDTLLIESPTYAGFLAIFRPLGIFMLEIPTDKHGINVNKLAFILNNWNKLYPDKRSPKALYTIPNGQNPSGCSLSLSRKKQIYNLTCLHDVLILEDDPYFFMTYNHEITKQKTKTFKQELGVSDSFFSMDTQGRVIRFDSLSKIMSAGIRVGYVTCGKRFLEKIIYHTQCLNMHTSGLSQVMALCILRHWGKKGFVSHIQSIRKFYKEQRDALENAVRKHCSGLVRWETPEAGMFLWLECLGIEDTESLIKKEAVNAKVLLLPGNVFQHGNTTNNYVRASYSLATPAQMDEAMSRFAKLLKKASRKAAL